MAFAAMLVSASCAAEPSPPLRMVTIFNVDGPSAVTVRLNGAVVATVPCGGTINLAEGDAGIPGLPWTLLFEDPASVPIGTVIEQEGSFGPQITIRDRTVFVGELGAVGPAPLGAPCPPATPS